MPEALKAKFPVPDRCFNSVRFSQIPHLPFAQVVVQLEKSERKESQLYRELLRIMTLAGQSRGKTLFVRRGTSGKKVIDSESSNA